MLNHKSQITNHKHPPSLKLQGIVLRSLGEGEQIQIPNEQNCKHENKFYSLAFWNCVLFVICILCIVVYGNAYALNLDKFKSYYLSGDYKAAIVEGEKILSKSEYSSDFDELYYILGLCYMQDGNYLRASDIFEIILKEFEKSKFKEEAKLGLGDTYFLREYYKEAEKHYKQLISDNPKTELKPEAYYRLSQTSFKMGDTNQANDYLSRLRQEFPLFLESVQGEEFCPLKDKSIKIYYSVQVGAFLNSENAGNLVKDLRSKDYPAFIEEAESHSGAKKIYRVKVGKFNFKQKAEELQKRLSREGYPTKICP